MSSSPPARPSVAVDLDGTLAFYDKWRGIDHIGDPLPGAREFLAELRTFARVVIWTTRCNPDVEDRPKDLSEYGLADKVHTWLKAHDMPYDEVFTSPVKPLAAALIDDRAISCRPMDFLGRPEDGGSYSTAEHYAHVALRAKHLCGVSAKQDKPVGAPPDGELFAVEDPRAIKG